MISFLANLITIMIITFNYYLFVFLLTIIITIGITAFEAFGRRQDPCPITRPGDDAHSTADGGPCQRGRLAYGRDGKRLVRINY